MENEKGMRLTNDELWQVWFWYKYLHRIDSGCLLKADYVLSAAICHKIGIPHRGFTEDEIPVPRWHWIDRAMTKFIRARWLRHTRRLIFEERLRDDA